LGCAPTGRRVLSSILLGLLSAGLLPGGLEVPGGMSQEAKYDENRPFPLDSDGGKYRHHTDSCCCILFLVVAGCMVGVAFLGSILGDTRRLTHGRDYHGRICGVDEMANKSFLYFCGGKERVGNFPKNLNLWSASCVAACPQTVYDQVPCLMREFVNTTKKGAYLVPPPQNITFISTLDVEVTQSVALQKSYPSVDFHGRYCVPKREEHGEQLYDEVVEGPLKTVAQLNGAIASFKHGWPVVLTCALLATALGITYLHVLKNYAGLLIYASMWAGTVVLFIIGIFFMLGVFADPLNEDGWYQSLNLIFTIFYGWEARLLSLMLGFAILAAAVCLLFTTLNENIDESIGVIAAAVDCLMGSGSKITFLSQPVLQSAIATVGFCVLLFGFALVASVVTVDYHHQMAMNGIFTPEKPYATPLLAEEVRPWYWVVALWCYSIGCIWIVLTFIAACHFIISFAVCDWYFVKNQTIENPTSSALSGPLKQAIANKGKRVEGVRVHGVDKVAGNRSGYIEKGPHGNVLVVPLGQQGPGGRDFVRYDENVTYKRLPLAALPQAISVAAFYHLGTIAKAAIMTVITAPFRGISEMIKAFLGANSIDPTQASAEDEHSSGAMVAAGFGLLSTFLDEFFGRYSKDLYVDVVLRSSDFHQAANDAFDFITETGGAVALLHGGTAVYELIGVLLITAVCTAFSMFLLSVLPVFANEDGALYVSDPSMIHFFVSVLCCMIASAFMSVFNITANTLLYVFAWSRKMYPGNVKEFCPTPLLHIVGGEIEEEPATALQPQKSKMSRFTHAASRYKDVVMTKMQGSRIGAEERPLLGGTSGGGQGFSSRR